MLQILIYKKFLTYGYLKVYDKKYKKELHFRFVK